MQNHLFAVIRNSLNAANAAVDALETIQVEEGVYSGVNIPLYDTHFDYQGHDEACSTNEVGTATPVAENQAAQQEEIRFAKLMAELQDPRWKLRTVSELGELLNVYSNEIYNTLDMHDVQYIRRTRRSDGAPLIGLVSRD